MHHHHHGKSMATTHPPPPWTKTQKKSKKNSHQNPPEIKPITTVRHRKSNPKPTQNSHHHREAHNADLTTPHATSTCHATPTPWPLWIQPSFGGMLCTRERYERGSEDEERDRIERERERERERTEWLREREKKKYLSKMLQYCHKSKTILQ